MKIKKINWTVLLVLSLLFTVFTGWSATPAEQKFTTVTVNGSADQANPQQGWMGIHRFELEIKLTNNDELEMEFEVRKGKTRATIERMTKEGKQKVKREEAEREIKALLQELQLTSELTATELEERVLEALKLNKNQVRKMDVEVDFTNGKRIEVEWEK